MSGMRTAILAFALLAVMAAMVVLPRLGGRPEEDGRPGASSGEGPAAHASPELRQAWQLTDTWLSAAIAGEGTLPAGNLTPLVRDMRQLGLGLIDPATRQACRDSFLARWSADPANPAHLEFSFLQGKRIKSAARVAELRELATRGDSTSAVALFIRGRSLWRDDSELATRTLEEALAALSRGDPRQDLLSYHIQRRLALIQKRTGQPEGAMTRLLALLPLAWSTGGLELLGPCWIDIAGSALAAERLDDALGAVTMAQRCARHNGDADLQARATLVQAQVHQERRQFALADSMYSRSYEQAMARNNYRSGRRALAHRTVLAAAWGDLAAERAGYEAVYALDATARDTSLLVFDALSLGDALRREGRLAQAEQWYQHGQELADAYSGSDVSFWVDRFRAILLSQLGRYAEAETLLVRYSRSSGARRRPLTAFGVQMVLLEQGLEADRPDLAYRALARAEELLADTPAGLDYDPALELRMMSAKLHARQGEYHLADADLAEVAELAADITPANRWYVSEAHALVAGMAGDESTATHHWRRCLALADSLQAPDLQGRSRVRLAAGLMASGDATAAARLVADDLQADTYWTRLNATIITGLSLVRTGQHEQALDIFAECESLLGQDPPADLGARVALERGKALAALDRNRPALAALGLARQHLSRVPAARTGLTDLGRTFNEHIVAEVAEALLVLLDRNPRLADGPAPERSREIAAWGRGSAPVTWDGPSLEYFVGREAAFAWSRDGAGRWTWRALPSVPRLERLVTAVTVDTGYPDRPVDPLAMSALGEALLRDLWPEWDEHSTLGLVPHGLLHGVPWAALPVPGSGQNLLARGPLALVAARRPGRAQTAGNEAADTEHTSGEALEHPTPRGGRLLILAADGSGTPGAPQLRHAEAEARAVARLWPPDRVTLRLQDQGDLRQRLREGLTGYQAIHISSHAQVYEGMGGQSAIHLAGSRGALTLPEVAGGTVDAQLVYLSSCQGGRRHRAAGHGVTSFAQAFLEAGAMSVVASRVLVEDEAARLMAESFYRNWRQGQNRAAALRTALLELSGAGDRWSHPYHWAYYQLHTGATPRHPDR